MEKVQNPVILSYTPSLDPFRIYFSNPTQQLQLCFCLGTSSEVPTQRPEWETLLLLEYFAAVATFPFITVHNCLAADLYRLSIYPSPVCALCTEENSVMNEDLLQKCTVLSTEDNIVKIYWDA
jgi:hypothetical protein